MTSKPYKKEKDLNTLITNVLDDITLVKNLINRRWLVVLPNLLDPFLTNEECKASQTSFNDRFKPQRLNFDDNKKALFL